MTGSERAKHMAELLDALDALSAEKKKWMDGWKLRRDELTTDLNMLREDVRQMRLDENEAE